MNTQPQNISTNLLPVMAPGEVHRIRWGARGACRLATVMILFFTSVTLFNSVADGEDSLRSIAGFWNVNWEKTAPAIQAVPKTLAHRFKTVEEFREFVAKRANGLVLEIQPKNSAVMYYPSGVNPALVWQSDKAYDVWLQQKVFMSASIGHGFKVSGENTAILTFQVEWNENVATRVPLFMERQRPKPVGNGGDGPHPDKPWWRLW